MDSDVIQIKNKIKHTLMTKLISKLIRLIRLPRLSKAVVLLIFHHGFSCELNYFIQETIKFMDSYCECGYYKLWKEQHKLKNGILSYSEIERFCCNPRLLRQAVANISPKYIDLLTSSSSLYKLIGAVESLPFCFSIAILEGESSHSVRLNIAYVNERFSKMADCSREELLNQEFNTSLKLTEADYSSIMKSLKRVDIFEMVLSNRQTNNGVQHDQLVGVKGMCTADKSHKYVVSLYFERRFEQREGNEEKTIRSLLSLLPGIVD